MNDKNEMRETAQNIDPKALKSKLSFWMNYQYEDENYPLCFVRLPAVICQNTYLLLRLFDWLYGDTDQETTDWALEYQLLTRNLLSGSLLVNPKYLDLSDEETVQMILDAIPEESRDLWRSARQLTQEEILCLFQESRGGLCE